MRKVIIILIIIVEFCGLAQTVFGQNQYWAKSFDRELHNERSPSIASKDGKIFVGLTTFTVTGVAFVVIKYDSLGSQEWIWNRRANDGELKEIVTDDSSNVFVAANFFGGSVIIKLNSDGQQLWINSSPYAINDLHIDHVGNVYVTGTNGYGITEDCYVTKYSGHGVQQWFETYGFQTNSREKGNSLTTDLNGNVFVCGESQANPVGITENKILFIKYNSNGDLIFLHRYGPSNTNHISKEIIVDSLGDLYITGHVGGGSFLILKFSPLGVLKWSSTHSMAYVNMQSIILDDSMNVYVTGGNQPNLSGFAEIVTIKLDSSGVIKWVVTYPGRNASLGTDIDVDGSNIYVTGLSKLSIADPASTVILKYDINGSITDEKRFEGHSNYYPQSLIVNKNIFTAGTSSLLEPAIYYQDVFVANLRLDLGSNWNKRFKGLLGNDISVNIFTDSSENVYSFGSLYKDEIDYDFLFLKYNKVGTLQYSNYGNYSLGNDFITSSKKDNFNNIYVLGYTLGDTNSLKLSKYYMDGSFQWESYFKDISNDTVVSHNMQIDNNGDIICSGVIKSGDSSYVLTLLKYNTKGGLLWSKNTGELHRFPWESYIVVDDQNNYYIAGNVMGPSASIILLKYSPSGELLFSRKHNSIQEEEVTTLTLKSDNIYIGGSIKVGNHYDFLLLNYDSSGTVLWEKTFNGSGNGNDFVKDAAIDNNGNIILTGGSEGVGSSYDYLTIKYSPGGIQEWVVRENGVNNSNNISNSVAIDSADNVYITGEGNIGHLITVKYNSLGELVSTADFYSLSESKGTNIHVGSHGNIFISGITKNIDSVYRVLTIKYSNQLTEMQLIGNPIPTAFSLHQNYPNPFNPSTRIKFDIPRGALVKLKIYDMLGREVAQLVNEKLSAGTYEYEWNGITLPSGVYFYKLITDSFTETKRMVLVK